MCGIVAVLRRRSELAPPRPEQLLSEVEAAVVALSPGARRLLEAAERLELVDARLKGPAGMAALVGEGAGLAERLEERMGEALTAIGAIEKYFDSGHVPLSGAELEAANAALVRLKDAVWAISRDRVRAAREVVALAGEGAGQAALEACWSVQVALSSLDRLEVRGRDSAGLHLLVTGHDLDPSDPEIAARVADPLFRNMSVRIPAPKAIAFVYKAAAEVGELGDNIRALRSAISGDGLLRRALAAESAQVTVLGHTRWASVGIISEANAHPLNDEEEGRSGPYVVAALNGDVDNHVELRAADGLAVPAEITTDAKIIPMLVSRRMAAGAFAADASAAGASAAVRSA
jgi:glucosamine--fructose-6-phosphate aminotransferase (isomerizing)